MGEKRKHFHVFHVGLDKLEDKLNELHATQFNVVQVIPRTVASGVTEASVVAIKLPSMEEMQAEIQGLRSKGIEKSPQKSKSSPK